MRLKHVWPIASILMLVTLTSFGQGFKDDPPRYNYDTLPKTSFSCRGKLAGRYYADAETDCQLFHVCVKMNSRDTQDFKFLCPNGTTFDMEHQVCMDYYNVVCHEDIGTNPYGNIYELMKLSSGHKGAGLDAGKVSFVDPDLGERNTLGDDFQVDEYNNNRLATSQNALNYQSGKSYRKPSSDIFYKSAPTKYTTTTTTTTPKPRPSPSTTAAPLLFRSPIPTNEPSTSATPRRPSLETFESYETESVSGFGQQNSFREQNPRNYEDSYEIRDREPPSPSTTLRTTTTTTTTRRPAVFQNTFRTSFPEPSSTAIPSVQTFQQQASRFNDDFFRKIPASTETSVSKAAQFYVNSNTDFYSTPEFRQPTTNPFYKTTTYSPQTTRRSQNGFSSTSRPYYSTSDSKSSFQNEIASPTEQSFRRTPSPSSTQVPSRLIYSSKTVDGETPSTTQAPSRLIYSSKTNDRGVQTVNRGSFTYSTTESDIVSTTISPQRFVESTRHSKYFVPPQTPSDESDRPKSFSAKIVNHASPSEDVIRPRSFSGTSNSNQVNRQSNRDNFGFSTIPPPTTAETYTRPTTTYEPYYQSEITNSKANTYFQKITTSKPEKYSIFFSKSTTYANKDYSEKENRFPASGGSSTVDYYEPTSTYRPPTTTRIPIEYEQKTAASGSRLTDFESSYVSTTEFTYPESTTTFPTTTTTTARPLRRGGRRRVNRPRQYAPKRFDPEFKYSRRIESASIKEKNEKETYSQNNEEIFSAQASVFPGRPKANLFQEERKGVAQVNNTKEAVQETKGPSQESPKLVENYGRRIRPNTRREQFTQKTKQVETEAVPAPVEPSNPPPRPQEHQQTQRRLIKRLKLKTTTSAPDSASSVSYSAFESSKSTITEAAPSPKTYSQSSFGSTLRPVTRINVKTKIANRKHEKNFNEDLTTVPVSISTPNPFSKNPFLAFEKQRRTSTSSTTTTFASTSEPELVTASDDEILRRKLKKFTTAFGTKEITTPTTTYRPEVIVNEKKNSTSVIIKVTNKSQQPAFPTPISFKEPILSKFGKKDKDGKDKEGSTRSPDYDYAYYNTDAEDDYSEITRLEQSRQFGKKPIKKALPGPA